MKRPERARQRSPGLTNNQPVSEVRPMADANSTGRVPDARSSNGTPLFSNPCPACGKVRLSDKRRLGTMCQPCATSAATSTLGGLSKHPLYKLLQNIRARCEYKTASNYAYYGGRGIKVCEEWRSDPAAFVAWAETHGYEPGLEIDREDNDGPYAPWNCRFVTHVVNSRKCRHVKCDEERARQIKVALANGVPVRAAARAASVGYMVAWHIRNGDTWRDA
jgi:hypothetical protein